MTDNTLVVTSYYSGQTTDNPLYYRRPANLLWNYIKGKTDALYLKEHQSLSGYLKATDAASTYQPKGDYLTEHQDISNMATKNTSEDITGVKTFTNGFKINTTTSWEDNDRSIPFTYTNTPNLVRWYNQDANKGLTYNPATGAVKAGSFVKRGGTANQFLKADGSIDDNTYISTTNYSSYALPLSGGTMKGDIKITQIRGTGTDNNYLLGNSGSSASATGASGSDDWFVGNYAKAGVIRSTGDLKHYNDGKGTYNILDSGNYSSYALPLSGGKMSGMITLTSGKSAAYNPTALNFVKDGTTEQARIGTDNSGVLGFYTAGSYIALRPTFDFENPDTSLGLKVYANSISINNKPIPTIWTGTEAQYNALTTKDNNTLYLIPE